MTGASLEIRADGVAELETRLGRLAAWIGDLTPLMRDLAAHLVNIFRLRFETNVGPDGLPWKPSLHAKLTGMPTLVDHGILRDSLIDDSGRDFAQAGTNDPRAAIHNFGGVIRPRNGETLAFRLASGAFRLARSVTMPKRQFIGLSPEDEATLDETIEDYGLKGLGTA